LNFSEGYTTLFVNQIKFVLPDPWMSRVLLGVILLAIPVAVHLAHQKLYPAAYEADHESTG